jgi:hypothetical protein
MFNFGNTPNEKTNEIPTETQDTTKIKNNDSDYIIVTTVIWQFLCCFTCRKKSFKGVRKIKEGEVLRVNLKQFD